MGSSRGSSQGWVQVGGQGGVKVWGQGCGQGRGSRSWGQGRWVKVRVMIGGHKVRSQGGWSRSDYKSWGQVGGGSKLGPGQGSRSRRGQG